MKNILCIAMTDFHEYQMWTNLMVDGNNLQICMVSYRLMQLRQVSRYRKKNNKTYLKMHRKILVFLFLFIIISKM